MLKLYDNDMMIIELFDKKYAFKSRLLRETEPVSLIIMTKEDEVLSAFKFFELDDYYAYANTIEREWQEVGKRDHASFIEKETAKSIIRSHALDLAAQMYDYAREFQDEERVQYLERTHSTLVPKLLRYIQQLEKKNNIYK